MNAADFLSLSSEILRCAELDDAGRILSYAESSKGKEANLPCNFQVTVRALNIQGLSESLPKELGDVRYTMVLSDKYRLLTLSISGRLFMFALPLETDPDPICNTALRRFGPKKVNRSRHI